MNAKKCISSTGNILNLLEWRTNIVFVSDVGLQFRGEICPKIKKRRYSEEQISHKTKEENNISNPRKKLNHIFLQALKLDCKSCSFLKFVCSEKIGRIQVSVPIKYYSVN